VTERNFVIATAGHVDHGKSALVKALTGTDPDRLPEEKAREITIDLGFAHLNLTESDGADEPISVSIIDVPGHEDFVRNMIAGLGAIDLALLVVAADDGWMPQTEEHFQILNYLRVNRIVIALNKSDLAGTAAVMDEIRQKLQDTPFVDTAIIPTSTRSGEGIVDLRRALAVKLNASLPQRDIGKARLFIDRAFTLPGIGSVVTGSLSGGAISAGQPAYVQPGNFPTRIRSVQSHRTGINVARPGMRTGVNVSDPPKDSDAATLRRGSVLVTDEFETSSMIDVLIEKSDRLSKTDPAWRALKTGAKVYLHHGTARIPAVLMLADNDALRVGQTAIAQLRLASPIVAFLGDRFVIRDRSEQHTIAGGTILYPVSSAKEFRSPEQQQLLKARRSNPDSVLVAVESEISRRTMTSVGSLLRNSNFSSADVARAIEALKSELRIVVEAGFAIAMPAWLTMRQKVTEMIDTTHAINCEAKGLDLNQLRSGLSDSWRQAIDALVDDLCKNGFVRRGSTVARAAHRPKLPPKLESQAAQILTKLIEKPFDPPGRMQIAVGPDQRQALRYLIDENEVVELSPDVVLSSEAFSQARDRIAQFIRTNGPATVSQLREELQTSRRIAVPLLERLDRDRLTRRVGDRRTLVGATLV